MARPRGMAKMDTHVCSVKVASCGSFAPSAFLCQRCYTNSDKTGIAISCSKKSQADLCYREIALNPQRFPGDAAKKPWNSWVRVCLECMRPDGSGATANRGTFLFIAARCG